MTNYPGAFAVWETGKIAAYSPEVGVRSGPITLSAACFPLWKYCVCGICYLLKCSDALEVSVI